VHVHVPKFLSQGEWVLTFTGTPADSSGDLGQDLASLFTLTLGGDDGSDDGAGPKTIASLAHQFADTARDDGVTASFREPGDEDGSTATRDIEVLRDKALRVSGSARVHVFVEP
jgi:hypothetical protein